MLENLHLACHLMNCWPHWTMKIHKKGKQHCSYKMKSLNIMGDHKLLNSNSRPKVLAPWPTKSWNVARWHNGWSTMDIPPSQNPQLVLQNINKPPQIAPYKFVHITQLIQTDTASLPKLRARFKSPMSNIVHSVEKQWCDWPKGSFLPDILC